LQNLCLPGRNFWYFREPEKPIFVYFIENFCKPGTASIMTMVVIGFDRYNVIVKGFSGAKITGGKAAAILFVLWAYSAIGCIPPFFGWGGYSLGK